jgi:hypothetical protein
LFARKGEVVPVLKASRMKTYWGSGGRLHAFSTSALDGGGYSASRPCCFAPVKRTQFICNSYRYYKYRKLILPVVLYVYETWSQTRREEHKRWRIFENRVLRRYVELRKRTEQDVEETA